MAKPKSLDIAHWALKLLLYSDFNSSDEQEFMIAFQSAYRIAAQQLREFQQPSESQRAK